MDLFTQLLANNRRWAEQRLLDDPHFFERLRAVQTPDILWIGCSDSRVPANEITGLDPGEVFVHRNIANVVPRADVNCTSVVQYAVETLKVRHILVCGHYGCGGVQAAMGPLLEDPLEFWVEHIRRIRLEHLDELKALPDDAARWHRLCELNVLTQVGNVARLRVVKDAWKNGRNCLSMAGSIPCRTVFLKDLGTSADGPG